MASEHQPLADGAGVMLAVLSHDGRIEEINAAVHGLSGRADTEVLGYPFIELVHGEDREAVAAALVRCGSEQRQIRVSHRLIPGPDGPLHCETVLMPIEDGGARTRIHASSYDVSSHRRLEDVLETSQALFHAVFETANEAIVATNEDLHIVLFNRAAGRLFDYAPEDIVGRDVELLFPRGGPFAARSQDAAAVGAVFEGVARRRDGSEFDAEVTVARQLHNGQHVLTGVVHNVTLRRQHEAELDRRANYDALTDLPNRSLLTDRLDQALAGAGRTGDHIGVLFVDLDGFKRINDESGHAVGDRVLQGVAHRLKGSVRVSDTVARIGGDEFVVLLAHIGTADDALRIADVIRRRLAGSFRIADREFHVTCSVGVAIFPEDGRSSSGLVDAADAAMYAAKQAGRNRIARAKTADGSPPPPA